MANLTLVMQSDTYKALLSKVRTNSRGVLYHRGTWSQLLQWKYWKG